MVQPRSQCLSSMRPKGVRLSQFLACALAPLTALGLLPADVGDPATSSIVFGRDIRPILADRCFV